MALPWLIGAAVIGLGSLIAAATSDDDKPSNSSGGSNGADEERRRREAAAKEQRRREGEEKRANARTLFEERGASIGDELSDALDDLIHVMPSTIPLSFIARLGEPDLAIPHSDDGYVHQVSQALREAFIEEDPEVERIVDNLEFHASVYDINMCATSRFYQKLMALDEVSTELMKLDAIEQQLRALKRRLAA